MTKMLLSLNIQPMHSIHKISFNKEKHRAHNLCIYQIGVSNKNVIKIYQAGIMAYYRKDQLSIKSRQLLADYLADLILITDSIESFRVALASTPHFSGISLFRYLDRDEKGLLVPSDFSVLVKDEGKKILHYAFSWFDVSKVGQVTKSQFLQFLFPRRHPEIRELITDRMVQQHHPVKDEVTLPAQLGLLQELVLQIMEREIRMIPKRRMLMDQEDYTIKAIMNCLDVEARGWITTGDVYKFLRNFDVDVNPSQACEMLGIYDHDLNGKIQLKELEILIEGLERSDGLYRSIVRNSDKKASSKLKRSRCICYKNVKLKSVEKHTTSKIANEHSKTFTSKKKKPKPQSQNQNLPKEDQKRNTKISHKLFEENKDLKQKSGNLDQATHQKEVFSRSARSKKEIGRRTQRKQEVDEVTNLQELRNKFDVIEKQTELMDQELVKIQEQMKVQTQIQMQRSLEHAHMVSKQLQVLELERRINQQLQLEAEAEKQRRLRKRQQQDHIVEIQRRMDAEMEIQRQKNRQKEMLEMQRLQEIQIQNIRIRQLQQQRAQRAQRIRIAETEQQHLRYIERRKRAEIQISTLEKQKRLAQEREIGLSILRSAQSQIDWQAEERLRILHQQQFRQRSLREGKSQKQSEYFWRYNNYCHNLASIGDPLGIKEHLVETDKYLIKSKQIRDQIKKDRSKSLNRYSYKKSQARSSKLNTEKDEFDKTPETRRDLISNIDKRTEQTKLMWS